MGNWDKEIDEVARSLIEGRPGAAFTADVLSRLDTTASSGQTRRAAWMGLAAAAALALAILVERTPSNSNRHELASRIQETTDSVRGTREAVGRLPAGADSLAPKADTTPAAAIPPAPLAPAGSRTVTTAGAADPERAESLALTPIEIERLDVDAMERTEAIQVPALDIPALEVSTLTAIARVDVAPIGED